MCFKTIAKIDRQGVPRVIKDDFKLLITSLNRSPVVKYVRPEDFEECWQVVDDDNSGTLEATEFYDLTDILQFSFTRVQTGGIYDVIGLTWPPKDELMAFVQEKLDNIMNIILIVNSILVVAESLQDLNNWDSPIR